MPTSHIPEGYTSVTPYMVVVDVDELVDFVKAAFGAIEKERIPNQDGKTGHAEVLIGNSHVMMGRAQDDYPAMRCMIYLYVPDADATWAQAQAAGATSVQEPEDMFYGDRSAAVRDPAGNIWTIATHKETLSPETLARLARENMR